MRILIVGGGGVGGYVAAKLWQHFDVTLYSRSLQRLFLIEDGTKRAYNVPIFREPPQEKYDLIIFAIKSNVLEAYIKQLHDCIKSDTLIYPLLNGILPFKILQSHFKDAHVLQGAIYIISNKVAPNTIACKGKGAMIVTDNTQIKEVFEPSGIKVKFTKEIEKEIWKKYLFIAATAALTSLYGKTFGQIAKEHLQEFTDLLEEIAAIAQKEGIHIDEKDKMKAVELLRKSPSNAKSSLQLDIERGELGEMENIIGYLATRSPLFADLQEQIKNRAQRVPHPTL